MTARVLILGGNGFIGSHIVDALMARGCKVRVFDRQPERTRAPLPGVDYRIGDFGDRASLVEALIDTDVVIHALSTTVPGTATLDPVADIEGNLVNSVLLLDLVRETGVRRLVFLSSGGTVYGMPDALPVSEDHPLRPITSYGIVKAAIEHYLGAAAMQGLETLILRPSNPYGPRQGHLGVQGVVTTFLRRVRDGSPIEIWGDGSVVRDYIFVGDLAELCAKAALSDRTGAFNAGSGTGHSINEVVSVIRDVTGKSVEPRYKPSRSFDVPRVVLDISRATAAFGWRPSVPLEAGVMQLWNWLNESDS